MKRRVPWMLKTSKRRLTIEIAAHYLGYLEARKKSASGETAERTVELINQLQERIRKLYHLN